MKTLDEIIAGKFTCTCHEAYKDRGLIEQDCFLCNEADTIKEIVAEQTAQMKADIMELRKTLARLNGCVDAFWNKRSYFAEERICLAQIGLKELITKTAHYEN